MLDWTATREVRIMPRKRYTPEEILQPRRTGELETGKGLAVLDACRKLGITEQIYYRWKKEYGGLRVDQAKRLKGLEQENLRLKRIVADQALDLSILKEVAAGNFSARQEGGRPWRTRCACFRSRSAAPAGPSGNSEQPSGIVHSPIPSKTRFGTAWLRSPRNTGDTAIEPFPGCYSGRGGRWGKIACIPSGGRKG
jgi:transposase-like protein